MTRGWLVFLLAGGACVPTGAEVGQGGGGAGSGGGPSTRDRLVARALQVARCPGSGLDPDVSGVYGVVMETVSTVSGSLPSRQTEVVTRYGVMQLCQDEERIAGAFILCGFDQSPLVDKAGVCAAELPDDVVVAALPGIQLTGAVDLATGTVTLDGFEERWGLAAGAALPSEPEGAAEVEAAGLLDQDEDEDPGVTVRGNGATPTVAWVAEQTTARISLRVASPRALTGLTQAERQQTVLGGPAARALRGRERAGAQGEILLIRADGLDGNLRLDANGDGLVQCVELAAWVGDPLPAPRPWPCQPSPP
ncbi:MAG: hypothetical protein KC549_13140 [Myxococcales bacterium]|nr:hypothetical protein [Myxococcales bacterium]MCB9545678.1 hypothetical protein [Myxococcales bacterium]